MTDYLVQRVLASKFLTRIFVPISKWYVNAMTYRQYGLRLDDIIMEENDVMQETLRRIPKEELYQRHLRHKVAFQSSILKQYLPKEQWTTDANDKFYLQKYWKEVQNEEAERNRFDHPQPKGFL